MPEATAEISLCAACFSCAANLSIWSTALHIYHSKILYNNAILAGGKRLGLSLTLMVFSSFVVLPLGSQATITLLNIFLPN